MLKCIRLVDLQHCAAFGRYYNFESNINVCNVNNVDSDHRDPVIVHLRCLCDCSSVLHIGLFILGYFINMHYGHIAPDKGASICERSVLSFVIQVFILHTKRTFHSAI